MPSDHLGLEGKRMQLHPRSPLGGRSCLGDRPSKTELRSWLHMYKSDICGEFVNTYGLTLHKQVRLTHILVSVSQCPPPLHLVKCQSVYKLCNQDVSSVLLGRSPRQDLPPKGERGCSCTLFPSRPKWSEGM